MTNIIEIKNLSFSYNKDNNIFNNLSLNIKKGKITTILGKNGCGKSTLIKLLAKNLNYNSGSIKLENKELSLIRNSGNKLDINLKFNGEKNNFFYETDNFKQNFLVLGENYSYNKEKGIFQFL